MGRGDRLFLLLFAVFFFFGGDRDRDRNGAGAGAGGGLVGVFGSTGGIRESSIQALYEVARFLLFRHPPSQSHDPLPSHDPPRAQE